MDAPRQQKRSEKSARVRLTDAERRFKRVIAREIQVANRGIAAQLSGDNRRASEAFRRRMVKVFDTYRMELLGLLRDATHAANTTTPLTATTVPSPQALPDDLMRLIGVQRSDAQERFAEVLKETTARDRRSSLRRQLDDLFRRISSTGRTEEYAQFRRTVKRIMDRNRKIIKGWIWLAVLDRNTCPACWAMHGSFHKWSKDMDAHINCRCIPFPLPYGETFDEPTGPALFDKLPDDIKRGILGAGKHDMYRAGQLKLSDLVGKKGGMVYVRPLKRLRRGRQRQR